MKKNTYILIVIFAAFLLLANIITTNAYNQPDLTPSNPKTRNFFLSMLQNFDKRPQEQKYEDTQVETPLFDLSNAAYSPNEPEDKFSKENSSENQTTATTHLTSVRKNDNSSSYQNGPTYNPQFIQGAFTPAIPVSADLGPWLTGPLIAKPNYCMAVGSLHFEFVTACNNPYGMYDNDWHYHNIHPVLSKMNFEALIQIGLASFMDLIVAPEIFYDLTGKVEQPWSVGDIVVGLGFQLMGSSPFKTDPLLKVLIGETLSVGSYQLLNPDAEGADAIGSGTLITSLSLLGGKLYHFGGSHWLSTRAELTFSFPYETTVHGENTYGGDTSTVGIVRPGAIFDFILSGEYTVTQNFVLSLDIVNIYTFKTTFIGDTVVPVGNPHTSYQLSLAPALEWNVSQQFGIIGGFWFTVAGANSGAFANGRIGFNWFF